MQSDRKFICFSHDFHELICVFIPHYKTCTSQGARCGFKK